MRIKKEKTSADINLLDWPKTPQTCFDLWPILTADMSVIVSINISVIILSIISYHFSLSGS